MDQTTNSLNWFEISASDIDRSQKFYENIFDVKFERMEINGDQMAFFPWAPGSGKANGSLVQSDFHQPSMEGALIYLNANPDLNEVLNRVEAAGGKILAPKSSIGDHGNIAFIIDTEGNRVGLHSNA